MNLERNEKPPYRVPSMAEIAAVPWNGLTVASTFSGCGGSSLGYRMAGFRVLWANEFIEAARDSYRANMCPGTFIDDRDIRDVQPREVIRACGLAEGNLDLLDGSPPCASFSTAGKRSKGWGKIKSYSDTRQRTDDLFFEFTRLVRGIQPRCFIAENVSGLVKGVAKGYFLEILKELKDCGYSVKCRVLDAQWLGVPQARARTIFVGVREDLKVDPAFPSPIQWRYSVRDAIPWIGARDGEMVTTGNLRHTLAGRRPTRQTSEPAPTISTVPQDSLIRAVEADASMTGLATGCEFDRMVKGQTSDRYFQLIRTEPTAPCPTVTAEGGNAGLASVCHPIERRKFSIAELKRICSFPDDFILTGSYAQQWERLGRAVPPLMMRAIAEVIRDQVLIPAVGRVAMDQRIAERNRRPLLIGQAPSKLIDSAPSRRAFSGWSGSRLAIAAGMPLERFLAAVEAINLLDRFPGRQGDKGDRFDVEAASLAASRLSVIGRMVLLAGRGVAAAFGLTLRPLESADHRGGTFVMIPHPSGINSWWNSESNARRAGETLRKILRGEKL